MTSRRIRPIAKIAVISIVAVAVLAYMISTCSWFEGRPAPAPEDGRLVRLTHTDSTEEDPAWSPHGDKIAFECLTDDKSWFWPFSSYQSSSNSVEVRNWPISKGGPTGGTGEVDNWQSTSTILTGNTCVMNADGSGRIKLTDDWGDHRDPAWSPDGSKIAFSSVSDGLRDIHVMNADGSGRRRVTHDEFQNEEPTWSPDGNRIAYTSWRDSDRQIIVVNVDGSALTQITDGPEDYDSPAWSPDGNRIAFVSGKDDGSNIYVMNPDGTERDLLYEAPGWISSTAWSPDGSRIGFDLDVLGQWPYNEELHVINTDGSGLERLTYRRGRDSNPAWSPDGSKLVFMLDPFGSQASEIYIMVDFRIHYQRLTDNEHSDFFPAWSPDGSRIAFVSGRDGDNEIYIMNADGSGVRQLTDNEHLDSSPAWSPDGSQIAYISHRHNELYYRLSVISEDGSRGVHLASFTGIFTGATPDFYNGAPSWSPDGTRIAFVSTTIAGRFRRHIINSDGTEQVTLDVENCPSYDSSWSPDGSSIAFSCRGSHIHLLHPSDGTRNSLRACDGRVSSTSWSPDSTQIVFRCIDRSRNYDLHKINVVDGVVTPIPIAEPGNRHPAWSPSGDQVAFVNSMDGDSEIYVFDLTRVP